MAERNISATQAKTPETEESIPKLHQLIREPTHITCSSSTLIDLIYTNCPVKVVCAGVSHLGIIDHSLVSVYRKRGVERSGRGHKTITYRKFKNYSREIFWIDIAAQQWDDLQLFDDPNRICGSRGKLYFLLFLTNMLSFGLSVLAPQGVHGWHRS